MGESTLGPGGRRTPEVRGSRSLWVAMLVVSAGLAAWVLATGLDRWPVGRFSAVPRAVPLALFVAGWAGGMVLLGAWAARSRRRVAWLAAGAAALVFAAGAAWVVRKVIRWRADIWLGDYLLRSRAPYEPGTVDVCFCFADHFEPDGIWNTPETLPIHRRTARMEGWESAYEAAIRGRSDSDGRPPQHTWFFPIQHAAAPVVGRLAGWPGRGWGEIEYHLHHDPQGDAGDVRRQIAEDLAALRLIGACTNGYAFVHGRYGLAAGDPAACRVVQELDLLRETGCYADFTFPNLGTPAQPGQVNSIFYARTTGRPKPHDRGPEARFARGDGEGLLIIPGALWGGFTRAVFDDANLSVGQPPEPRRIDRWLGSHVHVKGQPNWVFLIVHSHSASEYAQDMLWKGNMQGLWSALEDRFKRPGRRLHYVTAREVYNIVKAAEAGKSGNCGDYRDYRIPPPANRAPGFRIAREPSAPAARPASP